LTWSESEDLLFSRYEVYIREFGGGWELTTTLTTKGSTTYTVTGLKPSTIYEFKIRDYDSVSYADSNVIEVTTSSSFGGGLDLGSLVWPILIIIVIIFAVILAVLTVINFSKGHKEGYSGAKRLQPLDTSASRFCPNCGTRNKGTSFCPNCGSRF
jgi:predicted RNA-binding Zn-ribbon protein involved in translation (DUF1610 family)